MQARKSSVVIGVAAVVLIAFLALRGEERRGGYRTAEVARGDLEAAISATGTIEPEEVVDVGAQIAGKIITFGVDQNGKTVDYGSSVGEGTVLARIDDVLYAADVRQAKAQLQVAEATLLQAQAKFQQADRDWRRAQKLGPSDALAQSNYDSYQAAFESAKAGVAVAEASIAQARAQLMKSEQNLTYCTIVSPVSGVIIDRRVNIGQTVVASLNAPSLFLIAKDLRRMQVWVAVNEADVGAVFPGQSASFSVDAFPGQTFSATVSKIRLNASMTQNVVTYTVELITDNSSGTLLPYLTANVRFEVAGEKNVMLVPNAALRWSPRSSERAPAANGDPRKPEGGVVWVAEGESVRPVKVTAGVSDGSRTVVQSSELKEGMAVVVGEQQQNGEAAANETRNPFGPPQLHGRGGRS